MGEFTALLGVDWGTHSSKWFWKVEEADGSSTDGKFKILRSDVPLEDGALGMFVDAPPKGSTFKSNLKRRIIQQPDAPFWNGPLKDIGMTTGELVAYSLWRLARDAYQNFVAEVGSAPPRVDIRFSLPNWVDGRESAQARACYEQAARIACSLFRLGDFGGPLQVPPSDWHDRVTEALSALGISDQMPVDYAQDGFARIVQKIFTIDDRVEFRFVAESSAAGLAGLRKTTQLPPGYLHKILVIDVGAGSSDIGYVIRSVNRDDGREGLSQLPPAGTCGIAGEELTKRIAEIFRAKGMAIGIDEAEGRKVNGPVNDWIGHPAINDWINSIASHVSEYVLGIQDENWLPTVTPPLDVLVTGGSAAVQGLRDALATAAEAALRSRFGDAATRTISLGLPSPYDREANRLAVAIGAASEELPRLAYFRRLDKRIERPTVKPPPSWT